MTATSPHLPDKNRSEVTIDVLAQSEVEVLPTQSEAVASEIVSDMRSKRRAGWNPVLSCLRMTMEAVELPVEGRINHHSRHV